MSIIYNALQKTQRDLNNRRYVRRERQWWLDIVLMLIIATLAGVIAHLYFPKIKGYFHKNVAIAAPPKAIVAAVQPAVMQAPVLAVPISEIEYQGKLVLNGVFLSQQEKVALINNQPIHVGDMVEGKRVVSIELNKVKLFDQHNILILRAVS